TGYLRHVQRGHGSTNQKRPYPIWSVQRRLPRRLPGPGPAPAKRPCTELQQNQIRKEWSGVFSPPSQGGARGGNKPNLRDQTRVRATGERRGAGWLGPVSVCYPPCPPLRRGGKIGISERQALAR